MNVKKTVLLGVLFVVVLVAGCAKVKQDGKPAVVFDPANNLVFVYQDPDGHKMGVHRFTGATPEEIRASINSALNSQFYDVSKVTTAYTDQGELVGGGMTYLKDSPERNGTKLRVMIFSGEDAAKHFTDAFNSGLYKVVDVNTLYRTDHKMLVAEMYYLVD